MRFPAFPRVAGGTTGRIGDLPSPLSLRVLLLIAFPAVVVTGVTAGYRPAAAFGIVIVIACALALAERPVGFAILLAGAIPVFSGLKRGLLVPGFRPTELAIVGAALLTLVPLRSRAAAPWRAFDWMALAYATATAILGSYDLLSRGSSFTASDLGTLVGPFQYLVMYRVLVTFIRTPQSHRLALRLVLLMSPVVALSAIAQQVNVPGVRSLLVTLTGTQLYGPGAEVGGEALTIAPRATGIFPFWHETGGYLMMAILLVVGLLLSPQQQVASRRILIAIMVLDAAATVETVTFAPILGTVAGVLILGIWYGRGRLTVQILVVATIGFGAIFFPLLSARVKSQLQTSPGATVVKSPLVPQTIAYRLYIFGHQDIPALADHWLTGFGPALPSTLAFGFTESMYFTLLFRGGVILLAVYLALMYTLALRAGEALRQAVAVEQIAVARVLLTVLALLVGIHFIEGYFVDTGTADMIWVMAGLVAGTSVGPAVRGGSRQLLSAAARPWHNAPGRRELELL
jgi:hypothetical protein